MSDPDLAKIENLPNQPSNDQTQLIKQFLSKVIDVVQDANNLLQGLKEDQDISQSTQKLLTSSKSAQEFLTPVFKQQPELQEIASSVLPEVTPANSSVVTPNSQVGNIPKPAPTFGNKDKDKDKDKEAAKANTDLIALGLKIMLSTMKVANYMLAVVTNGKSAKIQQKLGKKFNKKLEAIKARADKFAGLLRERARIKDPNAANLKDLANPSPARSSTNAALSDLLPQVDELKQQLTAFQNHFAPIAPTGQQASKQSPTTPSQPSRLARLAQGLSKVTQNFNSASKSAGQIITSNAKQSATILANNVDQQGQKLKTMFSPGITKSGQLEPPKEPPQKATVSGQLETPKGRLPKQP